MRLFWLIAILPAAVGLAWLLLASAKRNARPKPTPFASAEAKARFLQYAAANNYRIDHLTADQALALMAGFYRDEKAANLNQFSSDMLFFSWGTDDGTEYGENFDYEIARQWMEEDSTDVWYLSLNLRFKSTATMAHLASGNHWCESLDELDSFLTYVRAADATQLAQMKTPAAVIVDSGVVR
ncbi:MAG: hypothetical protein GX444_02200 [Myxococcales bacterium]|nr:hypothetical protein [Myxococcales bacterium]